MEIEVIKKKKSREIVYPAIFEHIVNGMWVCAFSDRCGVVIGGNPSMHYPVGYVSIYWGSFDCTYTWTFIGNANITIEVEDQPLCFIR